MSLCSSLNTRAIVRKYSKLSIISTIYNNRFSTRISLSSSNSNNLDFVSSTVEFSKLGLSQDIQNALTAQAILTPTPVQKAVIPRLLNEESLVMAAATGSGKTLAYMLPIIQTLQTQEQLGYRRKEKRPRCLVLVPTRDLARQVLHAIKNISHYSKISSAAVLGGEQYGLQKKSLNRMVDIVVASPGRLLQHKLQGNVYLSNVKHIVIDEVDTMLIQGFGSDIRAILRTVLTRPPNTLTTEDGSNSKAQLVMATATLTKAVKKLLNDAEGEFNIEYSDPDVLTPRKARSDDPRIKLSIVEVEGLHRSLPNVRHVMEELSGGADKIDLLKSVIARHKKDNYRTLIFCNTVKSCKAIMFSLNDRSNPINSFAESETAKFTSYHGDLLSQERETNLDGFRNGTYQYMVCTDIASRGLDIPETNHVILFDFPLNSVDYIHRAGRCGRAGRKGLVTSLVAKRDLVLAKAIKNAVLKGLPIDSLSSDKRDYLPSGRLSAVVQPAKKRTIGSKVHNAKGFTGRKPTGMRAKSSSDYRRGRKGAMGSRRG